MTQAQRAAQAVLAEVQVIRRPAGSEVQVILRQLTRPKVITVAGLAVPRLTMVVAVVAEPVL